MDIEELPEGYLKHLNESKKFIEGLEREEFMSNRIETVDAEINRIKQDRIKTQTQTSNFIHQIKNGLGDEIKENPNEVLIIKKPWYHKISKFFKNVFQKI